MPTTRHLRVTRRGRLLVASVVLAALGAGAWGLTTERIDVGASSPSPPPTAGPSTPTPDPTPTPVDPGRVAIASVDAGAWWVDDDPGASVVAAARGLLAEAPVVVVADPDVLTPARGVAWRLRAPLVPADAGGIDALFDDLETATVVRVVPSGPAPADGDPSDGPTSPASASPRTTATTPAGPVVPTGDRRVVTVEVDGTAVDREPLADVPVPAAPDRGAEALVLVPTGDPARPLLDTVALAAGVSLVPVDGGLADDARARTRLRLAADAPWAVAGTSGAWEGTDRDLLAWDVEVVRGGHELPGGGLRMFPGRTLVALYGSPGAASLGVLGEQPVGPAIDRARAQAEAYAPHVEGPVVPTFEIITTVASGGAEPSGDYSRRVPHDLVEPWIEAAGEAGVYVILDLQPGRTDFLTQAREVEPLLRYPHVGLALDPEWRLAPDQVHLRQIGSVGVEEVQQVADWLADLTRREALPQKLLLLHQFRLSMLPGRERLQVPPELAVAIQMDGQGSQGAKDATWQAVTTIDPPEGVWFGWKNFHDEDTTLRSPADTMAVSPTPVLVSYQ